MPELRWILLGLGVLLIAVVYFWSQRRERAQSTPPTERAEPSLDDSSSESPAPKNTQENHRIRSSSKPDRIISLRLVAASDRELTCEEMVVALRQAGLRHGRYGIFHRHPEEEPTAEPLFSVANLVEPGSFDLSNMKEKTLPGVSFFLLLPCPGDAVAAFDEMVETARHLAQELRADLFDDRGSSWSIQRERYLREEIIEYKRQQELS